jgi:hypothetical protein
MPERKSKGSQNATRLVANITKHHQTSPNVTENKIFAENRSKIGMKSDRRSDFWVAKFWDGAPTGAAWYFLVHILAREKKYQGESKKK